MRYLRIPVFVALAVLSVAACSRNRPGDTATAQPADLPTYSQPRVEPGTTTTPADSIGMGANIFAGTVTGTNCASCHGADAKGTAQGPDLTDAKWLHGDGSLEFIKRIVRDGVPQPKEHSAAMPGFGTTLTEEQINAVSAYVRSRGQGAS
jgi:mono/diheme cytochrome c family protein